MSITFVALGALNASLMSPQVFEKQLSPNFLPFAGVQAESPAMLVQEGGGEGDSGGGQGGRDGYGGTPEKPDGGGGEGANAEPAGFSSLSEVLGAGREREIARSLHIGADLHDRPTAGFDIGIHSSLGGIGASFNSGSPSASLDLGALREATQLFSGRTSLQSLSAPGIGPSLIISTDGSIRAGVSIGVPFVISLSGDMTVYSDAGKLGDMSVSLSLPGIDVSLERSGAELAQEHAFNYGIYGPDWVKY